jgi:hypothetical protein
MNWKTAATAATLALLAQCALAQRPNYNVTIEGEITPGVYGRVEYGNKPPPPVIYTTPVVVQTVVVQPGVVQAAPAPLYVYAPPGHVKKWAKHCHKYSACAQPVYFVQVKDKKKHKKHKHHDD